MFLGCFENLKEFDHLWTKVSVPGSNPGQTSVAIVTSLYVSVRLTCVTRDHFTCAFVSVVQWLC